MQDSLCNWRQFAHFVFFCFCLDSLCVNELHHTQHISVFSAVLCLVPETLALEALLDRGCSSKFLNLENYSKIGKAATLKYTKG